MQLKFSTFEDLAWRYTGKIMQPLLLVLDPSDEPAKLVTHTGQEFNLVIEGTVVVTWADKEFELNAGDSIYFNPEHPHGQRCGGDVPAKFRDHHRRVGSATREPYPEKILPPRRIEFDSYEDFFENFRIDVPEAFNFGFDVVDEWARVEPRSARSWCDDHDEERTFTFTDLSRL